ncbi:MAG: hypothetical protein EXR99_05045 [Gemmataceae bacterium]|nr:hypothetical protein [Gemmataceae bacterium]
MSTSANPGAGLETLKKALEKRLASQKRSNLIVGIVGGLLLVLLVGYFSYGYSAIKGMLKPEDLVAFGTQTMKDQIPELRKTIETKVMEAIPNAAEMVTKSALDNIPEGRKYLEKFLEEQMDNLLEETSAMTAQELRKFVKDNKADLIATIRAIDSEKDAEKTIKHLTDLMEVQLGREILKDAKEMYDMLLEMNQKMAKLKAGKNLPKHEESMLHMLKIIRRIQVERATNKT